MQTVEVLSAKEAVAMLKEHELEGYTTIATTLLQEIGLGLDEMGCEKLKELLRNHLDLS